MLSWAAGLPIFEAYGRLLCRLGVKGDALLEESWSHKARIVTSDYCRDGDYGLVLEWLDVKFGIT